MRIIILSIALLFCAFAAQSQVLKSAGVWYFLDVDSMTARPAVLPNGTELAYVVGTKTVYYWNRATSTWTAYGSTFNRDSIYFDASIIGSGTVSDPWGVDSTLFATIAGVGDSIAAAVANYFPLQGGTLTGTGGAGFIGLPSQVTAPGAPASGLNIYAQGSSFNWKGTDGYERLFASTLTGGRTYTLPDVSGTFALGSGTTNRVPLWTTTNTLGSSNIQDNGTAVSILNSKPFQLGQWTTAGRPAGTAGYMGYNTTGNGIEWYQGSRWAYALESTFARGTATYIPYFDANGQVTENASLAMLGATAAIQIPSGTTAQRPSVLGGLLRFNNETQSIEFGNATAGTFVSLARANNSTGTFTNTYVPYGSGIGSRLSESGNFTYSGGVLQLVSGSLGVNNSPTGTTVLTGIDLARTAGAADPSVGSGIGILFRRRSSSGSFTANVLSHEIFAFSAGVVTSGYRFTVLNNTSGSNPATTAFLINGHSVSVPDGGFTVSNSTSTPYVNITTTASSGNKEAGLYIKSRGNFGAVIEFDNASTSPGASAGGNILNFYNYKTANSGFTVARMGGGNGNYGMDVIGQFTIRDSTDNLDRFQVNSNGTIFTNAYGTGTKEASDLSKTESVYNAIYATDGTILEKRANTEQYNNITSTTSPVTLSSTISDNLINQGSTQATFTLNMPASPVDGQVLYITYNNAITTLTIDGNGNTIVGSAVTTAVAGSQRKFKFYSGIGWIKQY